MKKLLVTILALVYLTTSIGATVHLHYCMEKLVGWELTTEGNETKGCSYCGMTAAHDQHCENQGQGCCKDEVKQVKLDNDQKIGEFAFHFSPIPAETITATYINVPVASFSLLTQKYPVNNALRRCGDISLFVLNSVFLI